MCFSLSHIIQYQTTVRIVQYIYFLVPLLTITVAGNIAAFGTCCCPVDALPKTFYFEKSSYGGIMPVSFSSFLLMIEYYVDFSDSEKMKVVEIAFVFA